MSCCMYSTKPLPETDLLSVRHLQTNFSELFNQNSEIQENAFQNVVLKMPAFLFRPHHIEIIRFTIE